MWKQSPAMFGVTARSMPWPFQPPRHPRHAVILHPSFIFSIHQNGNIITPIITLQTETRMTFFMLGNGKKVTDPILDRSMPAHCMPSVFFFLLLPSHFLPHTFSTHLPCVPARCFGLSAFTCQQILTLAKETLVQAGKRDFSAEITPPCPWPPVS